MAAPIPSASRGAPVTVTGLLNLTVTVISSPARKTPPAPFPRPERVSPVTTGAAGRPSTTGSPSVMAWAPKPRAAKLPAASASTPPFSAEAPTLIPFASRSAAATV